MDEALPASAVTCAGMVIASIVLSPPFLFQIKPHLASQVILCGCFTSSMGYIIQSLALVDTKQSRQGQFLGSSCRAGVSTVGIRS